MTDAPDASVALIVAAGSGLRLGLGPKAFLSLGGRTLLERAVDAVRPHVARTIVAVPPGFEADAARLGLGDAIVIAGALDRLATMRALIEAADAPIAVLHDVVHPCVGPDHVRLVMDAARHHRAAIAASVLEDVVISPSGALLAPAGEALVHVKPTVARREDLIRALDAWQTDRADRADVATAGRTQPGVVQLLARIGVGVHPVPIDIPPLKLTSTADWRWLQRLFGDRAGPRAVAR